jgi:hypothetical protein
MIKLTNLLNEIIVKPATYYALFNLNGSYNNRTPFYVIATSKQEMINLLNTSLAELTKVADYGQDPTYDMDDLGFKLLGHYINDDWAMVTDDIKVFKKDIERLMDYPNTKKPVKYEKK